MLRIDEIFNLNGYNKSTYYDNVTGFPNRNCLYGIFRQIYGDNRLAENIFLALMFIEFNKLKYTNDTFIGHMYKDELLKLSAELLKECIGNVGLVFRFSSDAFVTIVPYTFDDEVKIEVLAETIIERLHKYVKINSCEVSGIVNIGIALYPKHSRELDELLKFADMALYESKAEGDNTY